VSARGAKESKVKEVKIIDGTEVHYEWTCLYIFKSYFLKYIFFISLGIKNWNNYKVNTLLKI